jgi:hypothetical protein
MTGEPAAQASAEVARACADAHPGYELVGFGEVGIPFFELSIAAEVLEHKPIDPFAEFILRAVSTGASDMATMERLLGLDRHVLETTLVNLISTDFLRNTGAAEEVTITELGQEALDDASQIQVQATQLRVVFDPLLAEVIPPFSDFLAPKQLADERIREVGVPAGLVPELHQLEVGDVERAIRAVSGRAEQARDILALRSMRRFRVYRPAVAMAFRAKEANDVVADVAFDGRLSERHSLALAERGLRDKFIAKQAGRDRIADRTLGLSRAKVQPGRAELKTIAPWELPGRLCEALEIATERLVITSPGLQGQVLDKDLVALVQACVERGVSLHIGWGYNEAAVKRSDPAAVHALDQLASAHPNLNVRQLSGRNDNVLICDNRFLIASDLPWLSHRGDPTRAFGDERGLMISDSAYVEGRAEHWISRLTARIRPQRA